MLGIVPAAGAGTRIQPLAFSKEMLPVGSQWDGSGMQRPKAVSEFLLERMVIAGAERICFVISPEKTDIIGYYARHAHARRLCYVVQEQPLGLCDALFRAVPLARPDEDIIVGLPDTVWFPENGLALLPEGELSFLLFWVDHPERFDAVVLHPGGEVEQIQVKTAEVRSNWIWGAFRMPGRTFLELHQLWQEPDRRDEYVGTLVNAYLGHGGRALGITAGEAYHDIGTLEGYRAAVNRLAAERLELPA